MSERELRAEERAESMDAGLTEGSIEGCINCEFIEFRDGIKCYCSEYEKYVKEYDPTCKAYVENGSY